MMMEMITSALCVSLMLCHELDAVQRREWRMLPLLNLIRDDALAHRVFTALHIPLYVALLMGLAAEWADRPGDLRAGFDVFAIIHLGLHIAYTRHPENAFSGPLSWSLIAGSAIAGGVDLWWIG